MWSENQYDRCNKPISHRFVLVEFYSPDEMRSRDEWHNVRKRVNHVRLGKSPLTEGMSIGQAFRTAYGGDVAKELLILPL
jgi:hypothetical protein